MTDKWQKFRNLVDRIECDNFHSRCNWNDPDAGTDRWIQVGKFVECVNSGKKSWQWGRKWRISEHMTSSEFTQTLLMAMIAWQEHELRERFTLDGLRIFNPHLDLLQIDTTKQDARH